MTPQWFEWQFLFLHTHTRTRAVRTGSVLAPARSPAVERTVSSSPRRSYRNLHKFKDEQEFCRQFDSKTRGPGRPHGQTRGLEPRIDRPPPRICWEELSKGKRR